MSDELEIIKKAQTGDSQAFSVLIDKYKNMVYSLVFRMLDLPEDAEDVAQETFLKAFKSIKQFKGESKFSTWLYRIAYFTSINHLRNKKIQFHSIDVETLDIEDDSTINSLNDSDQKHYLNEALKYLKPIERNLISLYYLDDFSVKEIHEITGMTPSNIKVSLMRIRKKMYVTMKKILNNELQTLLIN